MKRDEFEKLIGEIGRGADVDQEELVEVLGYAGSAWYEIQQLTRQLCAGYRALQRDIKRKDQKLEVYMKMLEAARQENKRLRERLMEKADSGQIARATGGIENAEVV